MDKLKEEAVKLLWERFINRIRIEWQEKYTRHGPDVNTIDAPTKFAWDVCSTMKSYFAEKGIRVKMINPYTLHHYFQQGGFPTRIKTGTLDIFSVYLGYKRFSDFVRKNEKKILKKTVTPEQQQNKVARKRKRISLPFFFGVIMVVLSLVIWKILFSTTSKPGVEDEITNVKLIRMTIHEDEITNLINRSNFVEFNLYRSVPHINDTINLSDYYISGGPATKVIKSELEDASSNNRRLRISNSFFRVLDIKIIDISGDRAIVYTKEKWCLLWYKENTDEDDFVYNVVNEQIYDLRKIHGKWKIHNNDYKGEAIRRSTMQPHY